MKNDPENETFRVVLYVILLFKSLLYLVAKVCHARSFYDLSKG